MSCGIGYAGEGDVLTAAFTGALLSSYPDTSFVVIFCTDWEHDMLFLCHMCEMNIRVADKPLELFEKEFVFGNAANPIVGTAAFKEGKAVFCNVFQSAVGFKLLLSPVTMQKEQTKNFAGNIREWMKPQILITHFLEKLSLAGTTHHSILVYHATAEESEFFAQCLGIESVVTGGVE